MRCSIVAALVWLTFVPSPAAAQVRCGPEGEAGPTQTPWQLRWLDPTSVWPLTRGDDVTVAVIDSGVSASHPTLTGKVRDGRDFGGLTDHAGQCDEVGHGTIIAGIIAGRSGTDAPFWGIAPDATILPGRVLDTAQQTRAPDLPDRIGEAIRWAVDNGADVINLSLETIPSVQLHEAVLHARANDVVLVAAAGNVQEGEERGPAFPAAYAEVLAVAGVGADGQHAATSWTAGYIDVAAPGLDIVGPAPAGDAYLYEPDGGTSYAAAYVSGTVALVRAYHPDLTAEQVMRRVIDTADRPPEGHNDAVGYGVVNPYRAVTAVLGNRPNPPVDALAAAPVPPDPLAQQRVIAAWAALAGAVVTALLLLLRPLIRRGRQRHWQPARPTN